MRGSVRIPPAMIEQQCRVGFRLFRTILFGSAAVFWGAPVVGRWWAHHSRDSRKVRLSRRPEIGRSRRRRLLGGRSEKREGKADPVRAGGSSALKKEGTENTRREGRALLAVFVPLVLLHPFDRPNEQSGVDRPARENDLEFGRRRGGQRPVGEITSFGRPPVSRRPMFRLSSRVRTMTETAVDARGSSGVDPFMWPPAVGAPADPPACSWWARRSACSCHQPSTGAGSPSWFVAIDAVDRRVTPSDTFLDQSWAGRPHE